ncbi:unnamed protein product [Choristocarpus tenellus]
MSSDVGVDVDVLLQDLRRAEEQHPQSVCSSLGDPLPFRIVSSGVLGDSVLVPRERGADAEDKKLGNLKGEALHDAIVTSTLPFGTDSLLKLAPSCREELKNRYLNIERHIVADREEKTAQCWFRDTTWQRGLGSSLLTVSMSGARHTMAVKPVNDFSAFVLPTLGLEGPFPNARVKHGSGWEVTLD